MTKMRNLRNETDVGSGIRNAEESAKRKRPPWMKKISIS
jgi:hypothetical protein